MASELEIKLYHEARDRALTRLVQGSDFRNDCINGFIDGLNVADGARPFNTQIASWIKSESNYAFSFVCGMMCKLESVKGRSYGASWQKRGEIGILPNLQRKTDRLDVLLGRPGEDTGENLPQTLGDAAVYSAKWLVLRAEINPDEFAKWIDEVINLIKKQKEALGSV